MKTTARYEQLCRQALEVEKGSRSPRIREMHAKGRHCRICLGVTDPRATRYVFVGLNPGAECTSETPECAGQLSMQEYLDPVLQPHRYQINVRLAIESFAQETGQRLSVAAPMFGAVNLSFLHSGSVGDRASFELEVADCADVIGEELRLPSLEVLLFTGRRCEALFKRTHWRPGAAMKSVSMKCLLDADPRATGYRTTLASGLEATCVFTRHLSPRGPLPPSLPAALGRWLGAYVSDADAT